jgi:hypothetical protein
LQHKLTNSDSGLLKSGRNNILLIIFIKIIFMTAETGYSHLEYRQDLGILFFRWLNPVNSEQVIDGYSSVLQAHDPANIQCWLFDTRRRGPADPKSEAWYLHEFLPALHSELIKPHFIAVLLTPDHYKHVTTVIGLQKFDEANQGSLLTMQFFDSEHNAVDWLQKAVRE